LFSWQSAATLWVNDDVRFGVAEAREPLLPFSAPSTLREFNRVLDVASVGPAFYADSISASTDFPGWGDDAFHVEAGAERFADANRQVYAYGQYQFSLAASARRWAVLRPNIFFESFNERQPSYFSPSTHLTVGTMLHAIQQYRRVNVELEVNPQMLRTDGATGFGGHALFNIIVKAGQTQISGGTFVFFDSLNDYLQWRFAAHLSIPVKR
jgi:hypothetical protein